MDAAPLLVEIADAFSTANLEAILIGNAGAALHGAPVTTLDFDFLYRASPGNESKLRQVAQLLRGHITQPFPDISTVFRILCEDSQLQIDLTSQIHGVKSFHSLRRRAVRLELEGRTILVAALADITKSKKEASAFWPSMPGRRCCCLTLVVFVEAAVFVFASALAGAALIAAGLRGVVDDGLDCFGRFDRCGFGEK